MPLVSSKVYSFLIPSDQDKTSTEDEKNIEIITFQFFYLEIWMGVKSHILLPH